MVISIIIVSSFCFLYQWKKLKSAADTKKTMAINSMLFLLTIILILYLSSASASSITKLLDDMANALFPKAVKNFLSPVP